MLMWHLKSEKSFGVWKYILTIRSCKEYNKIKQNQTLLVGIFIYL